MKHNDSLSQVQLPDVELIVNLADWPLDKISSSSSPLPILSWCGSRTTRDILWPTYDIMRGTIQGMDRCVLLIVTTLHSFNAKEWTVISEKAFDDLMLLCACYSSDVIFPSHQ